jgi:hypothetical protein
MKIKDQHVYHGAALAQIVEFESFKALNKVDEKYGHYLVNTNRRLVLKYATAGQPWKFTFSVEDLQILAEDVDLKRVSVFVVLVCAHETVCVLTSDQFMSVIDIYDPRQQAVSVHFPAGGGMRVDGSLGRLRSVVPHTAFPEVIFE